MGLSTLLLDSPIFMSRPSLTPSVKKFVVIRAIYQCDRDDRDDRDESDERTNGQNDKQKF